jgi:hypothetical protein
VTGDAIVTSTANVATSTLIVGSAGHGLLDVGWTVRRVCCGEGCGEGVAGSGSDDGEAASFDHVLSNGGLEIEWAIANGGLESATSCLTVPATAWVGLVRCLGVCENLNLARPCRAACLRFLHFLLQ